MKILVIGRTGQIGAELCQLLAREHVPYIAPGRAELDITQSAMIQAALALHKPSIVINTAGYRSPSKAESEPSRCFALNRDAVAHLAKHAPNIMQYYYRYLPGVSLMVNHAHLTQKKIHRCR